MFHADGKNCKTCERILSILETCHDELKEAGIRLTKINDRKFAKQIGVLTFPTITFFKAGLNVAFEGILFKLLNQL